MLLCSCAAINAPENRTNLLADYDPQITDANTTSSIYPVTGEKRVVYDLNGYWKVWLGYAEAVAIIQDGNLIHCDKRTADNVWEKSVTAVTGHTEAFYCLGWPNRLFERLGPTEKYWPLLEKRY